jgi:RNA polymerase sigma factor (sigma-70 family)
MTSPVGRVVQHLRLLLEDGVAPARDGDLLVRFAASRDEDAFTALVHRHGPLVFGVCRRILHSAHDAEDAFQATFLVLARRASAIRQPDSLASWLYEVAYRLARKMKADLSKRRLREEKATPPEPAEPPDLSWRELQGVLDEELRGLPEKNRQPLLLCYLEGLTQEEAAGHLGWPRGTLKRRLERGRDLLKNRLTRRGLTLAAALGATLPAGDALAHTVPPALGASTARAATLFALRQAPKAVSARAVVLAEGVLRTMFTGKLKLFVAGAATLALLAAAVLACTREVVAAAPTEQAAAVQLPGAPAGEKKDGDKKQAEPLKITIEVPKDKATLAAINKGDFKPVIKIENTSDADIVVWPFVKLTLLDEKGNEVRVSMRIGRFGLRTGDKSILESFSFNTLKPGEALKIDVNVPFYTNDPDVMIGWKLPGKGEYTLRAEYKYDRAAVKKRFGEGTKDLDGAKQPWNRAVEIDKKIEVKLKVEGDDPEPQARFRDPAMYDHSERLVCHLYLESPERGAAPSLVAENAPERRWIPEEKARPMW